jgi:small subunit ribosomal protein S16
MLVIRMQRTGRKGHAMFRVIVQDSRRTPTSGKIVAALGSYDPHSKQVILDKEKAGFYLEHGAQPSERAARLLKSEGVKLPDWVNLSGDKERTVRNADKRRSTRPAEPEAPAEEADTAEPEMPAEEAPATDAPVEEAATAEETPAADPESDTEASEEVAVVEAAEEAVDAVEADAPTEPAASDAEAPAADAEPEASTDESEDTEPSKK